MPPVVVYWPDVAWERVSQREREQLQGWSWVPEGEGAACVVVVTSKQRPHLPPCCPPAQPVGEVHPGAAACTQAHRRVSATGGRHGEVWVVLSLPEAGTRPAVPRLHALWLHGRQVSDALLVTVLYEVQPHCAPWRREAPF
jgi:hypothetical protein